MYATGTLFFLSLPAPPLKTIGGVHPPSDCAEQYLHKLKNNNVTAISKLMSIPTVGGTCQIIIVNRQACIHDFIASTVLHRIIRNYFL